MLAVLSWLLVCLGSAWAQVGPPVILNDTAIVNGHNPSLEYCPGSAFPYLIAFERSMAVPPLGCATASEIRFARSTNMTGPWTETAQVIGPAASRPCGASDPALVRRDTGRWALSFRSLDSTGNFLNDTAELGGGLPTVIHATNGGLDDLSNLGMVLYGGVWSAIGVEEDPASPNFGLMVETTSTDLVNWTAHTFLFNQENGLPVANGVNGTEYSCYEGAHFFWLNIWMVGEGVSPNANVNLVRFGVTPANVPYMSGTPQGSWSYANQNRWFSVGALHDLREAAVYAYERFDSVSGQYVIGTATADDDLASQGLTFNPSLRLTRDCTP